MPFYVVSFGPSPSLTEMGRTKYLTFSKYNMGKQGDIKLRGRVENTIYYQWNGIHCMRTVPARVRQSESTKVAATKFGLAVKSAAALRSLLKPVLPDPANNALRYELDGAFRKWLYTDPLEKTAQETEIPFFKNFRFNKSATPGKLFRIVNVSRTNENDLLIQLPAFNPLRDVTAPKGTISLQLTLTAAVLSFKDPVQNKCVSVNWSIPYEDKTVPLSEIILPELTSPQSLVLVVMGTKYYRGNETMIDQMRWKPVGIVGSFYN